MYASAQYISIIIIKQMQKQKMATEEYRGRNILRYQNFLSLYVRLISKE